MFETQLTNCWKGKMTSKEYDQLAEFRGFCRNATNEQIAVIYDGEKKRAKELRTDFYRACARIAKDELDKRHER